ncbi:MAG: CBS domain-containing protein [Nevskia sp.]|nr:CBS domain-containing protein [Nevskia sp.]
MRVCECSNRMVVVCAPETSARDAARLMRKHDVGVLAVVEQVKGLRRPLGLVTERDLVRQVMAAAPALEQATVGELLPECGTTAHANDGLWETLERMQALGLRRLPVVDSVGALQGVLTIDDVLQVLAQTQFSTMRLLCGQAPVDRAYIPGTLPQPAAASSDAGVADWRRAA